MTKPQSEEIDFEITTRRRSTRLSGHRASASHHADTHDALAASPELGSHDLSESDDTIASHSPVNPPRRAHRSSADVHNDRDDYRPISAIKDKRLRLIIAIICLMAGAVMALMLLSHIRSGAFDQSLVLNSSVNELAENPDQINNAVGPIGAWLSQMLFTDSLGVGSLALAVYLIIIGVRMLRGRRLHFWSLTFKTLLIVISASIVLGFVTYDAQSTTSWGGTHGHAVTHYLLSIAGPLGPIVVCILLIGALVSVYINDLTKAWKYWKEHRHHAELRDDEPRRGVDAIHREPTDSSTDSQTASSVVSSVEINYTPTESSTANTSTNSKAADVTTTSDEVTVDSFSIDDESSSTDNGTKSNSKPKQVKVSENNVDQTDVDQTGFTIEAPESDTDDMTGSVADQKPYDHRASLSRYTFPSLELLTEREQRTTYDIDEQQRNKERIVKALADKKITIASIKATVGPTVTLFEIVPTEDIRVAQIKRLEDDIAMSLSARGIRIIAPLPGKGTVGIEVPNNDPQTVSMRRVLASKKFRQYDKPLPVALGATISNEIFVADLASMPHVLVAGATGQGKSVGLNALIASLLYKKHPSELKFVLIDPKEVEFSLYAKLARHYLATLPGLDDDESPIITSNERVLAALNSLCVLMDKRYRLLRKAGVRNIIEYNTKFSEHRLNPDNGHEFMPYIVVIIDEFADLIMTAGREIELPVQRITQKARAVGIHMVIATQRPSTNVLTGLIKANCPTRIAFRVMQMVDSRTILDRPGANQLIGKGDMLYSNGGEVERVQCAFISTEEVEAICEHIGEQIGYPSPYYLPEPLPGNEDAGKSHATAPGAERDSLFEEAARFIITQSTASTSSLQRRYQIGYNRAGKIMDQLEAAGIVSAASGSKPRQILVDGPSLELILERMA